MPASTLEADRKAALEVYESAELPEWRRSGFWTTSLKELDFDALQTRHYEPVSSREELPQVVQDAIAGEEYAGLIVQHGASVIYTETAADNPEGVIASTLEDAFANHEELVRKYYGTKVGPDDGKFAAGNAALWTGGAFFYVPKNTQVDKPFQVINVIDEPGTVQYGRLLAVVDVSGNAKIREYNLAPDFEGQALHAGVSEVFAQDNSWAKVKTFQDWGAGHIFDVSTKRVEHRARRPRPLVPDPPRWSPDQADARHHHRRARLGHAPQRRLLHAGRRAPRPLHDRPPREPRHDR